MPHGGPKWLPPCKTINGFTEWKQISNDFYLEAYKNVILIRSDLTQHFLTYYFLFLGSQVANRISGRLQTQCPEMPQPSIRWIPAVLHWTSGNEWLLHHVGQGLQSFHYFQVWDYFICQNQEITVDPFFFAQKTIHLFKCSPAQVHKEPFFFVLGNITK